MAYATVTLTGSYQFIDGSPARGRIDIQPTAAPVKDTGGDVVMSGGLEIQLDTDGHFSIALPATDDPALDPTGFGYTVTAKLSHGHLPPVTFALPASLGTLDMADVTPADPQVTYVPIGSTDAGVAAWVKDPASATRAALSATYAAKRGVSRTPAVKKPLQAPKKIITIFGAGHGWTTTNNVTGTTLNDTTDPGVGLQAVKLVTGTANTSWTVVSPVLGTPLNLTGFDFALLLKIEGLANLTDLRFYAGDSGLANAKNISFTPIETAGSDVNFTKEGEWAWITFQFDVGSNIGTPNRAALSKFQVRAQSASGVSSTVHLGALAYFPQGG